MNPLRNSNQTFSSAMAAAMILRLDAAARTGPPHAYIWPNRDVFQNVTKARCPTVIARGTVQPIDWLLP